ncbi:MAG: heme ABC exporter ATP-binding protein CcmA [Pontixanthobacter sp.]
MQACELRATHLSCRRGDRMVFRNLSFAARAGNALQIAGPNGAGKSSLMRICAGLLRPAEGTVSAQSGIGLLDERAALDPDLPLATALRFFARLDRCETVTDFALELGLDDLLDVPVRYLSTGQRRRAALLRLHNQRAAIWLLDEPLNGLDTDGQALLLRMIENHRANGGLCLVASHQPMGLPDLGMLHLPDFAP